MEWRREELHVAVRDPAAASMNFLNEVAQRFPDAVSLAAGRPYDGFYVADDIERYLRVFRDYLASTGMFASLCLATPSRSPSSSLGMPQQLSFSTIS